MGWWLIADHVSNVSQGEFHRCDPKAYTHRLPKLSQQSWNAPKLQKKKCLKMLSQNNKKIDIINTFKSISSILFLNFTLNFFFTNAFYI